MPIRPAGLMYNMRSGNKHELEGLKAAFVFDAPQNTMGLAAHAAAVIVS